MNPTFRCCSSFLPAAPLRSAPAEEDQMRRFRWWCGAVVLSLAATSAAGVAPAGAAGPGCGSVVTGSVVLQADLVNCPADGLIVGAPNTRIDLNGRTISGTNAAGSVGIRINGHLNVTIPSSAPFASIAEFTVGIPAEQHPRAVREQRDDPSGRVRASSRALHRRVDPWQRPRLRSARARVRAGDGTGGHPTLRLPPQHRPGQRHPAHRIRDPPHPVRR